MDKLQQIKQSTKYNRYPQIFNEIKNKIHINDPRILSFGCSTGEEVKTLNNLYFKNSYIDGIDIDSNIISKLNLNNKNKMIKYIDNKKFLSKYDLIFCMSVLCRWPETDKKYSFDLFSKILNDIDKYLNLGGYLCIYNSTYVFTDVEISKKYESIITEYKNTGFVTKYDKDNTILLNYPFYLFKKIID